MIISQPLKQSDAICETICCLTGTFVSVILDIINRSTHFDVFIYTLLVTGEMLVSPAKVLLMDEISNGLDSSTTFQIVNSLRQLVQILGRTAVISLLQPAPETYDLFDDIILLSEGHVVYQGPKEDVVEFFESQGFNCPHRKAIADFLLEVG